MSTFHKTLNVGEVWNPPAIILNQNVIIEGPGKGLSFIDGPLNIENNPSSGVDWGVSNPNRVKLKGFSMITSNPASGTAIKIKYDSAGSRHFKLVDIEDIEIASYNTTDYFNEGINLENVWFSSIRNINIRGKLNTTPQEMSVNSTALQHGIIFKDCIKVLVQDYICTWAKFAVKQFGRNENITIKDSESVACIYGVFVNGTTGNGVPISSNLENYHYNGYARGFWAKRAAQFNVSNCLFYRRPDDNFGDYVGMMIEDCWNFNVSNVILQDNSHKPADNGLVAAGNTNNGSFLNVRSEGFDTSAWLQSGSYNIDVCNVRGIVNHGTNNKIL
jgi:hypothetical protein